jgi:hypothetical protein
MILLALQRNWAHISSLALSLAACWVFIAWAASRFSEQAYVAMTQQDYSGLGAAKADFHLTLVAAPIFGVVIYGVSRLVIAGLRWFAGFTVSLKRSLSV